MSKIINKNLFIMMGVFLLIYLANIFFPVTFDDDFTYGMKGNVFTLAWNDYISLNGRYFINLITRVILQLKDPWTNFLTASIGFALVISSSHLTVPQFWKKTVKNNFVLLIPTSLILSCLVSSWTGYTQTGFVMPYYLSSTFLLLFLNPFFQFLRNTSYSISPITIILLGFIAGITHEQSGATIPILFMMIGYLKYMNIPIPRWFWAGFIGFIVGFLCLTMSPSNWSGIRNSYGGVDNWFFLGKSYNWNELGLIKYLYSLGNIMIFGGNPWLVSATPLSIIFAIIFKKNLAIEKDWTKQITPLLTFIYSWGLVSIMMFSPLFWYAQFNLALIFLYTSLGMILHHHLEINPNAYSWIKKLTIFCSSLAVGIWLFLLPVWLNYNKEYYGVVTQIQQAKQQNISSITVKPFSQYKINTPFGAIIPVYLYTSPTFYQRMAYFYEIDSIQVEQ